MKSTGEALRRRGYITDSDVKTYADADSSSLLSMLRGADPCMRTIAAKLMMRRADTSWCGALCEALSVEMKLYPRIAMSEALAALGTAAAPSLVALLGAIGGNQHTEVPKKRFLKRNYPLPRDLAARILGRMGPPAIPFLEEVLCSGGRRQIAEAIDAIGFIACYHRDRRSMPLLLKLLQDHKGDDLITWKIIRACQSYPDDRIIGLLNETIEMNVNAGIRWEAERSLDRISRSV